MSKEEKIKKNQGYLLSPPSSSVLAMVMITPEDLSYFKNGSGNVELLERIRGWGVDTFFVFTPESRKFASGISHLKFTSLMEAKGFYDISLTPGTSIIPWYFRALRYVLETSHPQSSHSYTGLTFLSPESFRMGPLDESPESIRETYKESITALLRVNRLDVSLPVMEIERRSLADLLRSSAFDSSRSISFLRPFLEEPRYQEGMYRTHFTPTLAPFFRPTWIDTFFKTVEEREGFQWFSTFTLADKMVDVIACGIRLFGMGWLDRDPKAIDLQKQTKISTSPNV